MAKDNRTTSTPRRATAAKATLAAAETLCRLEDEASVEVFGLEHLGALMAVWGDNMPPAGLSDREMLEIGNRVEYLGELVKRHAERIGRALIDVRIVAERLPKGGAQ